MSEPLILERTDNVLWLCLNRPEKKNALTWSMYDGLREALEQSLVDDDTRAVCIFSTGDDFCAGSDVSSLGESPPAGQRRPGHRFLDTLMRYPKPVVACIRGYAFGVGATMLLHADLVYAAPDTQFCFPFVQLGLVPEAGSSLLLPRLVGQQRAAELLLLGERFDVSTAKDIGIVNDVIDADELLGRARKALSRLTTQPPQALADTKRLMRADLDALSAHMDTEFEVFDRRKASAEFVRAQEAFLNKRKRTSDSTDGD